MYKSMMIKISFIIFQCRGKYVSWSHLYSLYKNDSGKGSGLSLIPKLKFEHLNLTSFSKMRVDLAAQVYVAIKAGTIMLNFNYNFI